MTTLTAAETSKFYTQRTMSGKFGQTGDWFFNLWYTNHSAYQTEASLYESREDLADNSLLKGCDGNNVVFPISDSPTRPRPTTNRPN